MIGKKKVLIALWFFDEYTITFR